ncbi:hypothetical protein Btru_054599 [Bulinus truncatus]|nr:hypothetical protein Btru_054599 [Bulinus truncatus]
MSAGRCVDRWNHLWKTRQIPFGRARAENLRDKEFGGDGGEEDGEVYSPGATVNLGSAYTSARKRPDETGQEQQALANRYTPYRVCTDEAVQDGQAQAQDGEQQDSAVGRRLLQLEHVALVERPISWLPNLFQLISRCLPPRLAPFMAPFMAPAASA